MSSYLSICLKLSGTQGATSCVESISVVDTLDVRPATWTFPLTAHAPRKSSIEEKETKNIIKNLKPKYSSGLDSISLILLKASINYIAKPLTCIINQSLKTGRFPSKLKVATIIPIFKKADEHDFNNYRPISLLPSISKVFEKTIYSQFSKQNTQPN